MSFETSFDVHGRLIFVAAAVTGPTGRANLELVLDTGAAMTTLVPSVVEAIGYTATDSIRRTVTRTAAANEYGYLIELDEISTLGVTVPSLYVNVAELGYGVDGVLGMNFLIDFNLEIRPRERRIAIEPATAP